MKTQPALSVDLKSDLTPVERLANSRSEIVNSMKNENQVFHVLKPIISNFAKSDPIKTLGIAAVLGAAIVVLKPWRLITLGSMLAVIKSRM